MKSNYRKLGELIKLRDKRNTNLITEELLGISIDKEYMPSVANVIGTDLTKYKIIEKNIFACNPMHVGRDEKLPVALYKGDKAAIVSPAYFVFEIIDRSILNEEYLMMWFRRSEFDRNCWFKTDGSVRGGISWNEICELELPVPEIEKQKSIIKAYKNVTDRIILKQQINDNLVQTIQTLYKHQFIESGNQYNQKPLIELCSKIGSGATPKGGKTAYREDGISLIRSTNIFDYGFTYKDLAHISDEQANALSNVVIEPYDVLFNITGVSIARCCIAPMDVLPARVNQHVMILRPVDGKSMSYYMMATLCFSDNKSRLLGIGQSGSTREAINKQEMENFIIPVPPQDEIVEFGERTDVLYTRIEVNVNEIQQLESLQQMLLSQLSSC